MEITDKQIKKLEADNQALKEDIHVMTEQLVDLQNANEKAEYYKERYEKAFEKLQSLSAENEDLRKKNEDFQTILHEFAERARVNKIKRGLNPEEHEKVEKKEESNKTPCWDTYFDSRTGVTYEEFNFK